MGLLDGRVAVVTGSGRGIGREFALCFAREGAHVVVNDVGVALDGRGTEDDPAAQVCREIEALGGAAVPNYDSVSDFDGAGRHHRDRGRHVRHASTSSSTTPASCATARSSRWTRATSTP